MRENSLLLNQEIRREGWWRNNVLLGEARGSWGEDRIVWLRRWFNLIGAWLSGRSLAPRGVQKSNLLRDRSGKIPQLISLFLPPMTHPFLASAKEKFVAFYIPQFLVSFTLQMNGSTSRDECKFSQSNCSHELSRESEGQRAPRFHAHFRRRNQIYWY